MPLHFASWIPPALALRLRQDFRLGILALFSLCAAFALLPMALARAYQDELLTAAISLLLVAFSFAATAYAWRRNDTRLAARLVALVYTVGCLLAIHASGPSALPWLYPLLVANALLLAPLPSLLLALGAVGAVQFLNVLPAEPTQWIAQLLSLLLVALLSSVFARHSRQQHRMLRDLALQDALTGAGNRLALHQELAIAQAAFQRDGRKMALAILDLDHFKQVNDRLGHEAGDRVLCDLVTLLQSGLRGSDRLFRFGGEEFVLLAPDTNEAGLDRLLGYALLRVRDGLRAAGAPVTVSAGGAVLRHRESTEEWLARADAALYRAKRAGHDRAVVDGADNLVRPE